MTKRLLFVSGFALGSLFAPATAFAQSDTTPAKPNVLLLVDTSGSMEWKSSTAGCPGNRPCFPQCDPSQPNNGTTNPNEKSRWTELLEVMTGSIQKYSCFAEQRTGTAFSDEFKLGTQPPYDNGYENPYHRAMSDLCVPGPGVLPPSGSPYTYPNGAIAYKHFDIGSQTVTSNTCSFGQWRDGLLDAYEGLVRFGLMTFDTHPDASTGISGTGSADYVGGPLGTWSYFIDGAGVCKNIGPGGACMGAPWNCGALYPNEVGARNAAAPPWEGRMVGFGPPPEDGRARNQWIQEILLATRPYGATPIAGMLADARNFLWNDKTLDPLNPGEDFGPWNDPKIDSRPFVAPDPKDPNPPPPSVDTGNCRQEFIILLTDGEPNLELRPECINPNTGADTTCPYDTSAKIAAALANPSDPAKTVRTFVVGFALGNVKQFVPDGGTSTVNCETMDIATQCNPMPTDRALKACCVLNQIAWEGTPASIQSNPNEITHALFPASASDLRQALDKILRNISTKITGRTFPVTATAPVAADPLIGARLGVGYEFDTGVDVHSGWKGILTRKRFQCVNSVPTLQTPSVTKGDDFAGTLNKYPRERTFFTFVAADDNGVRHPQSSLRPWYSTTPDDGVGLYGGLQTQFVAPESFAAEVPAEAMGVSDATCDTSSEDLTKTQCRDRLLDWAGGVPSTGNLPSRCRVPDTTGCNVLGDIFHSQPQIRTKPNDLLPDDTYAAFAVNQANRDTLLYVSSNDGFLHSFLVSPGDLTTNASEIVDHQFAHQERWAFVPPAVLPFYFSMYPGTSTVPGTPPPNTMTRKPILDGTAVIKDVAGTIAGTDQGINTPYPYRYERMRNAVQNTEPIWRTVLLEGFGPQQGGFFALDITKPAIVTGDSTSGPRFLWQLTTDSKQPANNLFGRTSPNPLITTLYFDTKSATDKIREVAVAVLPGGDGDAATAGDCEPGPFVPAASGSSTPRRVRCYNSNGSYGARSLTIVRLDTGAVVQTFRPKLPIGVTAPVVDFATGVAQYIDISSPIVGQPVAYPAQTGQIADRIFVGDRDGRVWRVDVSDTDPTKWTMQVFFDAYPSGAAYDVGQPVQNQPMLSVDQKGQITMAFSTGDQDNLEGDVAMKNYVVSTTEVLEKGSGVNTFKSQLEWIKEFLGGERVVGPLTLFDRVLYFSSVVPSSGTDCHQGFKSNIWAFDYLEADSSTPPKPKTDILDVRVSTGAIQKADIRDIPSLVAGVGLRQLPSCSTIQTGQTSADAFLGYGKITTIGANAPGGFQLVYQKNGGNQTGTTTGPPTPQVQTIDLAPPNNLVQVDSWAPIIE